LTSCLPYTDKTLNVQYLQLSNSFLPSSSFSYAATLPGCDCCTAAAGAAVVVAAVAVAVAVAAVADNGFAAAAADLRTQRPQLAVRRPHWCGRTDRETGETGRQGRQGTMVRWG
jgi:hypothetical protein